MIQTNEDKRNGRIGRTIKERMERNRTAASMNYYRHMVIQKMLFCRLELKTSTDRFYSYNVGSGYAPARLNIHGKITLVTLVVGVWAEA